MPEYKIEYSNSDLNSENYNSLPSLNIISTSGSSVMLKTIESDNDIRIFMPDLIYIDLAIIKKIKQLIRSYTEKGNYVTLICNNKIGYGHIYRIMSLFRSEYYYK